MASGLALGACGSLVPQGSGASSGTASGQSSQPRVSSVPQTAVSRPEEARCIANLSAAGARFSALPDAYDGSGCSRLGTVQLSALSGDMRALSVSNIGPVQCRTANAFNAWARFGVDRAARQILGSPLVRIETMGSYSCRNIAGSNRRSAHATAGAIDVSGFILEDGRRITLAQDWDGGSDEEREFLRVIQSSACKRFATVLGPDYNRAHEDHFHLEGGDAEIERGSFCR
ncbi:extensin family protein [Erythrobacter sp. MTPC3]|uniref:extensin-like domain-containing protein n=1 Tax=Erythrobacter sp. MTPC3 TaxID=3056564 RepID=UPI0036F2A595